MSKISYYTIQSLLGIIVLILCSAPCYGEDNPNARKIMEMAKYRDDGDNLKSSMLLVLINKNGGIRKKKLVNYVKDYGKDKKNIMFIEYPRNIENTGFLTFDYDSSEKDDDQWLYLPDLGKTKRIASSDKSGSFMGSDLNYSDMTFIELNDYDFKMLKSQKVNGQDTWVISCKPRSDKVIDRTGYKKIVLGVRQDNYVIVRAKLWEDGGDYIKYLDVKKLEKIDGIWIVTEMHITRKIGKLVQHKTILQMSNIKFQQKLDDDLFSVRRLEKGI
jgi:outer membrane lipoprotein-sorting protein